MISQSGVNLSISVGYEPMLSRCWHAKASLCAKPAPIAVVRELRYVTSPSHLFFDHSTECRPQWNDGKLMSSVIRSQRKSQIVEKLENSAVATVNKLILFAAIVADVTIWAVAIRDCTALFSRRVEAPTWMHSSTFYVVVHRAFLVFNAFTPNHHANYDREKCISCCLSATDRVDTSTMMMMMRTAAVAVAGMTIAW